MKLAKQFGDPWQRNFLNNEEFQFINLQLVFLLLVILNTKFFHKYSRYFLK